MYSKTKTASVVVLAQGSGYSSAGAPGKIKALLSGKFPDHWICARVKTPCGRPGSPSTRTLYIYIYIYNSYITPLTRSLALPHLGTYDKNLRPIKTDSWAGDVWLFL